MRGRVGSEFQSLARNPPSTGKTTPVIHDAASLARNATARDVLGVPARPSGIVSRTMSSLESPYFSRPLLILVGTYPGATTLTVMGSFRLLRIVGELRARYARRLARVVRKRRVL